jgi:hypothetical protein
MILYLFTMYFAVIFAIEATFELSLNLVFLLCAAL